MMAASQAATSSRSASAERKASGRVTNESVSTMALAVAHNASRSFGPKRVSKRATKRINKMSTLWHAISSMRRSETRCSIWSKTPRSKCPTTASWQPSKNDGAKARICGSLSKAYWSTSTVCSTRSGMSVVCTVSTARKQHRSKFPMFTSNATALASTVASVSLSLP
eukprot:Amastigsp_a844695_30.p2 type:complete len:167 gc:universal Amastigsp_a844695_30:131-631(+)